MRGYVTKYRVDDLPPLRQPIADGIEYDYKHMTRDDIHSVWMNNPPTGRAPGEPSCAFFDGDEPYSKGIVIYGQLVNLFDDLFDELVMKYTYGDAAEVLIPREKADITSVWKQGDDLRVLVGSRGGVIAWQAVDLKTWRLTGPVAAPPIPSDGYLLDRAGKLTPSNGAAELSSDDRPLRPLRSLQAAATEGEVWAADGETISGKPPTTKILRYDTKDSTRRSIQTIEGIEFDSMAMWVDEAEGRIYAAANGDLVRISLGP